MMYVRLLATNGVGGIIDMDVRDGDRTVEMRTRGRRGMRGQGSVENPEKKSNG